MAPQIDSINSINSVSTENGTYINSRIRILTVKAEPDRHFKVGSFVNTKKSEDNSGDIRISAIIQDKIAFLATGKSIYTIWVCPAKTYPEGPHKEWKKLENMPVMIEYDQTPLTQQ